MVEDGYEFYGNRNLVTVFSAPNYCGTFDNSGAVMDVDESLCCKFHIFHPPNHANQNLHKSGSQIGSGKF